MLVACFKLCTCTIQFEYQLLVPEIFIATRWKPCAASIKPDPQNAQCMTKRFPHGVQGWSDSLFFIYFLVLVLVWGGHTAYILPASLRQRFCWDLMPNSGPERYFSRLRLSQSFGELKQFKMGVRPLIEVEVRTVRIMALFRDEEASAHMQHCRRKRTCQ